MGVRPYVFVMARDTLVRVLDTEVRRLAEEVGAQIVEHSPNVFDTTDYVIPGTELGFLVDVADPAASVRAHLARGSHDVRDLFEALASRGRGPRVTLVRCHRRWWVGSIAAALRDEHRLDDEAIDTLAHLVGPFGAGDPDVDRVARTLAMPDRLLTPSVDPGVFVGELPVVRLASVLERVGHRRKFGAPIGRYGVAPAREDTDAWSEWVGDLAAKILRVANDQPDDWMLCYVS